LVVAVIVAVIVASGARQSHRESTLDCREATARAAVADILPSHERDHERPGARHAAEQIVYEEAGRLSRVYRERDTPTAGRKRIDR